MTTPDTILGFWFQGDRDGFREAWFRRDDAFDATIRARFGDLLAPAAAGALDAWAATPQGTLALLLLLDQFPRNLHRGTAAAFAADPHARAIARRAVFDHRHHRVLTNTEQVFLYLPFEHSEALPDQELSVALCESLRQDREHAKPDGSIDYAWRHYAVIRRFSRFPARNAALGRVTTAEEADYLAEHPYGF